MNSNVEHEPNRRPNYDPSAPPNPHPNSNPNPNPSPNPNPNLDPDSLCIKLKSGFLRSVQDFFRSAWFLRMARVEMNGNWCREEATMNNVNISTT